MPKAAPPPPAPPQRPHPRLCVWGGQVLWGGLLDGRGQGSRPPSSYIANRWGGGDPQSIRSAGVVGCSFSCFPFTPPYFGFQSLRPLVPLPGGGEGAKERGQGRGSRRGGGHKVKAGLPCRTEKVEGCRPPGTPWRSTACPWDAPRGQETRGTDPQALEKAGPDPSGSGAWVGGKDAARDRGSP